MLAKTVKRGEMVKYIDSVKRAFSDWKKLGIGTVVSIVPIVSFFAQGYELSCAKTAAKKKIKELPEWNKWGDLFAKGFLSFVIGLIYALPGILIIAISLISVWGSLWAAMMSAQINEEVMSQIIENAILQNLGLFIIGFLITFIGLYLTPMATVNYIVKNKFSEGFNFKVVSKKTFTTNYFVALLFIIGFAILLAIPLAVLKLALEFTVVLPLVTDSFMSIVIGIVSMTIYGQVYSETK